MFYAKIAVEASRLEVVKSKIGRYPWLYHAMREIPSPEDNFRIIVILKYRDHSAFDKWLQSTRTAPEVLEAVELGEQEYKAMFPEAEG